MPELERALRELEAATADLIKDPEGAQAALDRRARAIAELAGGAWVASCRKEETARRLQAALEAGAHAMQQLTAVKHRATAEWRHWSAIYRGLSPVRGPGSVDFKV
ncbi:MAG TPA: hypothetical protein VL285_08315 [Bryobacteraceae bacterium]|nr:hypothetical protein [Bryobacteraceae bacterium]